MENESVAKTDDPQWTFIIQNELIRLFRTAFNDIWDELIPRSELSDNIKTTNDLSGSIIKSDDEALYSQSCDFFQKLLSSTQIVPQVRTSLSINVICRIQKSASSVLKSFRNTESTNRIESNEINKLLQMLQMSNEILEYFSQKSDSGLDIGIESVEESSSTLFENLISFLIHPNGKGIKKSLFIQFLLTARKIWSFLKSRSSESNIVQFLALAIENHKSDLFTKNPNASLFVRFCAELLTHTGNVDWKSVLVQNRGKEEFLSILIPIIEVNPALIDAGMIHEVRKRLTSKDSERRKEASFVVKSLSSILAGSEEEGVLSAESSSEILRHLGREKFLTFWSNYFELYEILDEKQSHIIEPVLQSKMSIFVDPDTFTCKWFFVILSKMIHHDNRHIAEAGFIRFLNNRVRDKEIDEGSDLREDMFEEFLNSTVLPFLKDHAAWILPEAEGFFKTVEEFGCFLSKLYKDELVMTIKIIGFIIEEKKCLSPCSLYFLIQSLHKGLGLIEPPPSELKSLTKDEDLQNCMSLICQCTSQGLTTVDKFLRLRVEDTFVDIVSSWKTDLGNLCKKTSPEKSLEILLKLLTFIGALSPVTVIDNPRTRTILGDLAQEIDRKYQFDSTDFLLIQSSHLSPLQISGLFRIRWLASLQDPLVCKRIVLETIVGMSALDNKPADCKKGVRSMGIIDDGLADFVRGLSTTYEIFKDPDQYGFILDVLKEECISRIEEVKHLLKSENQSPSTVLKTSQRLQRVEIIFNSFENQTILPKNGLLPLEDVLLVLEPSNKDDHNQVCAHFLMWKLLGLLPDDFDTPILEKLLDLFCSNGFETLKPDVIDIPGKGNLTSEFYKVKFDSLASILERHRNKNFGTLDSWKKCIVSGLDHVEKAGPGGVISAIKFVRSVLPFLEAFHCNGRVDLRDMLFGFTDLSWNLIFEMRKSESFWIGIREFVDLITQPFFAGQGILRKFSERMFKHGETVTGLTLVLVQKIADRLKEDLPSFKSGELEEITDVCLTSVLFGPGIMKTNKVSFGLWAYLNSTDQVNVIQDDSTFGSNARTRIIGVWILQRLVKLLDGTALTNILTVLLDRNDKESVTRKRYFGNSLTHRIKQRIAQTVLILQPYFDLELTKLVLERLMDSLTTDSPQPSVRYLSEWVVIKMLLKHHELWQYFFEASIKCCIKRVGFGAFFSTICLHTTALLGSDREEEYFFKGCLNALAELILGHHVTVRIYAQASFREIYKRAEQRGWTALTEKYSAFQEGLDATSMNSVGNFSKLLDAVSKDFYLQIFNAETHYVPEVIFIYLPQLSEVADDELPLESYLTFQTPFCNPFSGNSKELKLMYQKYKNLAWHLKATAGDGREMGEEVPIATITNVIDETSTTEDLSTLANFQKKINPWKSLSIVDEIEDFSLKFLTKKRSAMEDGLIVVASLIDKIPNLGGLCRSCEIFGVSKYVIPSLKILQDQNFVSLSVSAHNWVDVLEVPPRDLESFISTYAAKGYTILGVEQASESTRLNDFNFPKKSLLLLGNEKYGIPTNLLHLVDKCIEIPQVGVIRSLNVHVTGALCIWEYAAQHSI